MSSEDTKSKVLKARRREEGSRSRVLPVILILLFVGLLGAGGYYVFTFVRNGEAVEKLKEKVFSTAQEKNTREVNLYFADSQLTRLVAQKATVPGDTDKTVRIEKLIGLLSRGPEGNAGPVLPKGIKVRQVYLGANGIAIIDFEPDFEELKSSGAGAELLTVFALVQTITENVEGIKAVRLLVGGKSQDTLAGNVSISDPLVPRADLTGSQR